jgi:hypothetical protein
VSACCAVVELRRYTLQPGARETLVDLFETRLIEPQEELGMHVVGQFRDEADHDAFVWFRGFTSMAERRRCLEGFYDGPVWQRHREAANATMVDSDDVHLLRPLRLGAGWPAMGDPREPSPAVFELTTYPGGSGESVPDAPAAGLVAELSTLGEVNDFPRLPVRRDDVMVRLQRFDDERAYRAHRRSAGGLEPATVHVLRPTARSQLS